MQLQNKMWLFQKWSKLTHKGNSAWFEGSQTLTDTVSAKRAKVSPFKLDLFDEKYPKLKPNPTCLPEPLTLAFDLHALTFSEVATPCLYMGLQPYKYIAFSMHLCC